jgi:hypothetical protein
MDMVPQQLHKSKDTLSLWVCVGLYGLALVVTLVQWSRHASAAKRQREERTRLRQQQQRRQHGNRQLGETDHELVANQDDEDEDGSPDVVLSMTKPLAQMSAALILRLFWLVATALNLYPKVCDDIGSGCLFVQLRTRILSPSIGCPCGHIVSVFVE